MAVTGSSATITVVIPTHNRKAMLERAVRSVLDERRVPILLRVQDNASTDGTELYMRSLAAEDSRVTYIRHPVDIGPAKNVVECFRAVQSEYFVPLADDDYLLPDFLFDAYALLEADDELGAAAFYAEARDEAGRLINTWPNNVQAMIEGKRAPAEHLRDWMIGSHYSWQAVLWRSSILSYIGDPFHHTGMPSDVDFQAQVIAKFPVFVVKRPGAVFFVHDGQASHGLSVADVPSWAKLFARLDEAVETSKLFSAEEYLQLRSIMWHRMRPSWLRPSKSPMSTAVLGRIMICAGYRLGDWELAFHLASELGQHNGSARSLVPQDAFRHPTRFSQSSNGGLGHRLNLVVRTLQSLQGSMQREQMLSSQVTALASSLKVLQEAALAVTADRNRLAAELTALQA